MAPVSSLRYRDRDELTIGGIVNIISYWPTSQRTRWYDARICLGETQTDTLDRFDLCYSFKMLCRAEYGGTRQLHVVARNYMRNYTLSAGIPPEPTDNLREGIKEPYGPYVLSLRAPTGVLWIPRGPPDSLGARVPSGSGRPWPLPPEATPGEPPGEE